MKYGQTIYNLRKKSGLSQERVAEELKVTRQSISLWETEVIPKSWTFDILNRL